MGFNVEVEKLVYAGKEQIFAFLFWSVARILYVLLFALSGMFFLVEEGGRQLKMALFCFMRAIAVDHF